MVVFKYCWIPIDEAEQYTELAAELPAEFVGDLLLELLKARFADGASVKDDIVQDQFAGTAIGNISAEALNGATACGSCEIFPLQRPSEANGHRGINVYLDEVGVLKNLPINKRATALANTCGHSCSLHGQIYIGRTQGGTASQSVNVDFSVNELDSSAAWVQTARLESIQQSQQAQAFHKQMDASNLKQVNIGEGPDGDDDADGSKGYSWRQTDEDVEFSLDLPEGMTAKRLEVQILPKMVKVMAKDSGALMKELKVFAPIRPDDSTWTVSSGLLQISLEKVSAGKWPMPESSRR